MAERVTLAQIAEVTGVSVMTVSNVMNNRPGAGDTTRERVLAAARELGYQPATSSRHGNGIRSGVVGVITLDLTNQYALELLRGIADALAVAELEVLVSASYQDSAREYERVKFLADGLVDGVILVAPELESRTIDFLVASGRPFVVIDPRRLEDPVPRILVDNYEGMRSATRHVIELGHTRIAYLQGPSDFESSLVRRAGFDDAMKLAGLPIEDDLVMQSDFLYAAGFHESVGLLQRTDRPTAVVAGADVLAFAAIDAARSLGLDVPGDVSIVGFDDLPRAEHSFPGLTTVRQPLYEMGKLAARTVIDQIGGESPLLERFQLPTSLVVRGTTRHI